MDRGGLRRILLKAQAEAGDIVLLFGDESEALTHPYLAHAWAKKGADLRIPAPGQAAKVAMLGVLRLYQPKTAFPLIFLRFIHRIRKSVKGKTRVR